MESTNKNGNHDFQITMPSESTLNIKFVNDIKSIIEQSRLNAFVAINQLMIETYWNIGKRIVEEEQNGNQRAEYGKQLLRQLSNELTREFGQGYSDRYLRAFRRFYLIMPNFEIWKSRFPNLTWTHVFQTLRVGDETAIRWYLETAADQMWSVRVLNRNISTQYYERHFTKPSLVKKEKDLSNPTEMIKSPIVAEFLGIPADIQFSETQLEAAIISHLQRFMMELGRGFAFMKRQWMVKTSSQNYFIDLVFYNVILKCYVLVDLKVGKVTHQDAGQMLMYVGLFDDEVKRLDDNPTIGIVLASETDEDIARYMLRRENNVYMSKYLLYLPSKEELTREIEQQKAIFALQQESKEMHQFPT